MCMLQICIKWQFSNRNENNLHETDMYLKMMQSIGQRIEQYTPQAEYYMIGYGN